jgi:dTMP kinase
MKRDIMKFIAFEGLDGGGKSTLIEGLRTAILAQSEKVTVTREPGGTALGQDVRELLLSVKGEAPTPRAELLLYIADRAQHVEKVIQPALMRREWVISDRYTASTVAFQVGGRGLNMTEVQWLNQFAVKDCQPDLWVLLDLSTDEAKRRMQGRQLDRFEREEQSFHQRVRDSYLQQAHENKAKWLVLDAALSKSQLLEELLRELRCRQWLQCEKSK